MERELQTADPATVLSRILTAAAPGATYYAVDLPTAFTTALGPAMEGAEGPPTVRTLAGGPALRALRQDFLAASVAANHVEADTLAIRRRPDGGRVGTPLVVGEGAAHALVTNDNGRAGRLASRHGSFQTPAFERCAAAWDDARRFPLRTPARDRVGATMADRWDEQFRVDFAASLAQASAMRNPAEFEEVTAALLVAAKHGAVQYEVSKWGEDVGLASKATFSRRKTRLEEMNVVETEPVDTPVGRPRKRLSITDEYAPVVDRAGIAKLISRVT